MPSSPRTRSECSKRSRLQKRFGSGSRENERGSAFVIIEIAAPAKRAERARLESDRPIARSQASLKETPATAGQVFPTGVARQYSRPGARAKAQTRACRLWLYGPATLPSSPGLLSPGSLDLTPNESSADLRDFPAHAPSSRPQDERAVCTMPGQALSHARL